MEMLRDENWVLSVGTFLPMVGVLLLLIVPKEHGQAESTSNSPVMMSPNAPAAPMI